MTAITPSQFGESPWDNANLFPAQGDWSVADFLALNNNRHLEFVEGRLEFLPMPTKLHQLIVGLLYRIFYAEVCDADLGEVFLSGYRVKVADQRFREPDLVVVLSRNDDQAGEQYTAAADLVIEVVSPDDPRRDLEVKRAEYATAGIAEYWIVDPRDETVTILTLPAGETVYTEAGKFTHDQKAKSVLLEGLEVNVAEVFSQP